MEDLITGESLLSIHDVKPLEDYKLLLKFSNGEERIFDVTPLLDLPVYRPLKDITLYDYAVNSV